MTKERGTNLLTTSRELFKIRNYLRMNKYYFSVIIPCYNVANYLRRCLDSVVNQTFSKIEIIVIDDKSTDNTLSIIQEYRQKDARIRVIVHEKNRGVACARNSGVEIASGKYVSFVDPDDYLDQNFYEMVYLKSLQVEADIIKGAAYGVKDISKYIVVNKYFFYAQWWSAVYKLDLICQNSIKFPEDVFCGQDFVFQRHACICANNIVLVENSYYHYCKRKNSLDSKRFTKKKIESQLLARKYIVQLSNNKITNEADYFLVISRVFGELEWLWSKTSNTKSRYLICEKYLELYNMINCKSLFATTFPMLYIYMEKKDLDGLYEHLKQYHKEYKYVIMSCNNISV